MDVTWYRREASAPGEQLPSRAEQSGAAVAASELPGEPVLTGTITARGLAIVALVPQVNVRVSRDRSVTRIRVLIATDCRATSPVTAGMPAHADRRTPVGDVPAALSGTVTSAHLRKISWSDGRAFLA